MTETERKRLLDNIEFIIDSAYYEDQNHSNSRITRKGIIESLDMSYVTYMTIRKKLSNDTGYTPQDGTLFKFVGCFNRRWKPDIDISILKHKDLRAEVDFGSYHRKELTSNRLNWYCGCYFCYYYSRRCSGLRYGMMNIYRHNTEYYAQLITGFSGDEDLDILLKNTSFQNDSPESRRWRRRHKMNDFFKNPKEVEQKYKDFLYGRDPKDIKYYFYKGKIELYEHALLLNLFPENHTYKKMITFKRPNNSRQSEYQGGLGAELTLAHEIHSQLSNSLRLMGISREYINDIKNISELLQIDIGDGQNIDLSTKDYVWFNLAVGRNASKKQPDETGSQTFSLDAWE